MVIIEKVTCSSEHLVTGGLSGILRIFDLFTSASVDPETGEAVNDLAYQPDHMLLEKQLDQPILQIDCGHFSL